MARLGKKAMIQKESDQALRLALLCSQRQPKAKEPDLLPMNGSKSGS